MISPITTAATAAPHGGVSNQADFHQLEYRRLMNCNHLLPLSLLLSPPLTSSVYLCKHRVCVCVYTHARARALACVYLRAVQKVVVNISQIRGGGRQGMWFQTIQPPSKITGVKPVITGRRLLICGRHQAGRWVKRRRPLRSNITIGKHPKRRRMRRNSIEAGSMALAPMTSPVNEIKCGAGGQTIAG